LAGYSYNDYLTTKYNYQLQCSKVEYPNSDPSFPFDKPQHTLISFFGGVNYSYKDRYFFSNGKKMDHPGLHQATDGTFPSVALAWNINDEKFLADSKVFRRNLTSYEYRSAGWHRRL
jgi:iron complex outermembrane receptor protein